MKRLNALLVSLCLVAASVWVSAQNRGTKEEAVALANAAITHIQQVGLQRALKDFTNDKATWVRKDLYVASLDWKGISLAHGFNPKQVGRNLWEAKDPNGLMLVQEMIHTAQSKGDGWVAYQWPDPLTKKLDDKLSYVRRVPGQDLCITVGIYRAEPTRTASLSN